MYGLAQPLVRSSLLTWSLILPSFFLSPRSTFSSRRQPGCPPFFLLILTAAPLLVICNFRLVNDWILSVIPAGVASCCYCQLLDLILDKKNNRRPPLSVIVCAQTACLSSFP